MKDRDRKELKRVLLYVDKELQLYIGGAAMTAIAVLTPHRASLPGSTVDDALDQMRSILNLTDRLQCDLKRARQLLRKKRK